MQSVGLIGRSLIDPPSLNNRKNRSHELSLSTGSVTSTNRTVSHGVARKVNKTHQDQMG